MPVLKFTPRETQVIALLETGVGAKGAAARLGMSPHTLKTHVGRILLKCQAQSFLAALYKIRQGEEGPQKLAKS